ncbi:MAG: hypothetical protein AB1746_13535, partial [Candidatus Zixiibacteriota bacterium]
MELKIDRRSNIMPGETVGMNIYPFGADIQVSEFELRIVFDASVLSITDIIPGPFYADNQWEYFDYRILPSDETRPDSLSGIVRIKAVADLPDNDEAPTSLILPAGLRLVSIRFNTIDDSTLNGNTYPIRFYWTGCGDNVIFSGNQDTVYISNQVYDRYPEVNITDNTLLPTLHGAPDICLIGDMPDWGKTVIREIDFHNGYIAFAPDIMQEPFSFMIEMKGPWEVGIPCDIGVIKTKGTEPLRGFDFLIGYNMNELIFWGANTNELTRADGPYQWEYFTYRFNDNTNCGSECPSGLIRFIGLAETNDGAHHPLSLFIPDGMELFTMQFRPVYSGVFSTIDFYWIDCGDNAVAFSYRDSTEQIKTGLSEKVFRFVDYGPDPYDEITDPMAQFPTYFGAPSDCFEMTDPYQPSSVPFIRFYNGGIDIVSLDIDVEGDVNLNGIAYEIADFVLFMHQMTRCNYDLFTINIDGQKDASDVNRDGIPMTIEDLVYIARIISGDALPGQPFDTAYPGQIMFDYSPDTIKIQGSFSNDVGGIQIMYLLDYTTTVPYVTALPALQEMQLDYNICHDTLKILVYDIEGGRIEQGDYIDLLSLNYYGKAPDLISVTAASYDGHKFDLFIDQPFEFKIEKAYDQLQGHRAYLDVTKEKGAGLLHGFDLLIGYDPGKLAIIEASTELTNDTGLYQWEYFTYRYSYDENCDTDCPAGLLRVVGMADYNDGPHHPLCLHIPDGTVLFTLAFMVSTDYGIGGAFLPVNFYWQDCGDNAVAYSENGDPLTIKTGLSKQVYKYDYRACMGFLLKDVTNPESGFPTYTGTQNLCFDMSDPDKPKPVPFVNFIGGGVWVLGCDVDARGDVNLNGIPIEIADFVLFAGQLTHCNYDLFTINIEGQRAATEVNGDGITMTIEDLVYMARIIVGDALPCPTDTTYPGQIKITELPSTTFIQGSFQNDVGGIYMMYLLDSTTNILEVEPKLSLQEMTLDYNICFDTLKILVYNLGSGHIPAWDNINLLNIHYNGKVPNLISVTAASYEGHKFDLYVEEPFEIGIGTALDQLQGHTSSIDVVKEKGSGIIYGFNFLIGFDQSALTLNNVVPGELFDGQGDYQWEYFTYRYNENGDCGTGCPSGLLRVVGLAETNDGEHHPLSRDIPNGMTLFNMDFTIASDYQLAGTFVPIDFYWMDCGDNAMSFEKYGYYTGFPHFLALSRKVYRFDGTEYFEISDSTTGFPTFTGMQWECLVEFDLEKPTPIPIVDYYGGGIGIIEMGELDARCDFNLNGVLGDTMDCRIFRDRLLGRDDHSELADCSDFNGDGIPMTIEDYVCLTRYGEGIAPSPDAIDSTLNGIATFYEEPELILMSTDFDLPAGGMLLTYRLTNSILSDVFYLKGYRNMTVDHYLSGDTLRIIIYNRTPGEDIPAGLEMVMGLKYIGDKPQLVSATAAGLYGRKVELQTNFEGAFPVITGDLDLDGVVNILDIVQFIKYFNWGGSAFDIKEIKQSAASDIDWDGNQLTLMDMVLLVRIIYLGADFGP